MTIDDKYSYVQNDKCREENSTTAAFNLVIYDGSSIEFIS